MKIFLIGFMGSGKTTFGKKLASSLDYPFFDLDHQIEASVNQPIPQYFAAQGEESFRKLEKQTLQEYAYPEDCVVSCGGGSPCYFDNMDWMNENGLTIYLEMPVSALAGRLEKGKHKRPLLKDLDQIGLLQFIEGKLAERLPFYSKAKLTVSGIDLSPEAVKGKILDLGFE
jgi:shikimate kinase